MPDPFGTTALRAAVLGSWAGSPTRFREDANAEEDLRLGGYADAWFVELAQNASDAAAGAGRVRVTVVDGSSPDAGPVPARSADGRSGPPRPELRVANTGTPLDAAGVAALASLRASAKRDTAGSVGRFGVGFAAVLAVSDAPRVVGAGGGVEFSAARTAEAVAALPGPSAELARRDEPPVLRLAWPTDEEPPEGFATEVRLPLRPGVDAQALLAHARDTAADLLLALPGLVEIAVGAVGSPASSTVDPVVLNRVDGPGEGEVTIGDRRWLLARRAGTLDDDVREQAVEQRSRREWSAGWALPLTAGGVPEPVRDDVAHAPTATAERLTFPARLIATLPLEPDRRRVRPGPVADHVLAGAAAAYLDLVRAVAPALRLPLVPEPGFPRSELDGRLRGLALDALRGAAWLPAAGGGELVPGRAEWLDLPGAGGPLLALLAGAGFDRLLAEPTGSPTALAELGVHRLAPAEMVSRLFGVERPPAWWHALYTELAALAETVPGLLDELRALPVPLAGGRTASGPATVLLPAAGTPCADSNGDGGRSGDAVIAAPAHLSTHGRRSDAAVNGVAALAALALPGLHIAEPGAVHPLLARLGANPVDPAGLLEHPALAEAVDRSVGDADAGSDQEPLATAVLALVVEHGGAAPEALAALALPDSDGRPARADELMLPDAALGPLLADDAPLDVLDAGWAARFPRSALTAIGVVDGFAVLLDEDPTAPDHDLDDEERWWDSLDRPPARLLAVRDLDLIADDAWPAALALLASGRETRAAVTAPGSYAAWWLSRHARLGGHRPGHWRLATAEHLATLYDPVPGGGDEAFLVAIGVRADLVVADARAAADLLDRLADPSRHPDAALVADAHDALADAVAAGRVDARDLDLPEHVRALDGSVTDVDVALVLDAPWPAAVLPAGELVIGGDPVALAELLDLPLATEVVAAEVEGDGKAVRWAALPEVVIACHTLGVAVPPGELNVHEQLWVQVHRPVSGRVAVPVWLDAGGAWHASDPLRALLALLATR